MSRRRIATRVVSRSMLDDTALTMDELAVLVARELGETGRVSHELDRPTDDSVPVFFHVFVDDEAGTG